MNSISTSQTSPTSTALHIIRLPDQPSVDGPFEMLTTCHQKVDRMLGLIEKLRVYLLAHPCDQQAQQAAQDIKRYFNLAGPLHHQDEEMHVFPPLLADRKSPEAQIVLQLQEDHRKIEALWVKLNALLSQVVSSQPDENLNLTASENDVIDGFFAIYKRHIQMEESIAYVSAKRILSVENIQAMHLDMMRRRGVT